MKKIILIMILCLLIIKVGCSNIKYGEIEGIAIFNKDNNFKTEFIPKGKIHLEDIVGEDITENIAVITDDGSINIISSDIYLDRSKRSIYVFNNNRRKIEDVKGIYLSDEFYSNRDAYLHTIDYLDRDKKIMIILLDGFSYEQYKVAKKMRLIPYLSQYFVNEALTVYKPVTNAGFAAIITGETPVINGIHDRSHRALHAPSIFDYTLKNNKKAILLEADMKILNTEIEPELHIDINKDGDIDDEIYQTALEISNEDYDLIFIHFHGIDDRGHNYGPLSDETMKYIDKVDKYVKDINEVWENAIIVTSDHGMHNEEDRGNHGECIYEDMIVPYFHKEY